MSLLSLDSLRVCNALEFCELPAPSEALGLSRLPVSLVVASRVSGLRSTVSSGPKSCPGLSILSESFCLCAGSNYSRCSRYSRYSVGIIPSHSRLVNVLFPPLVAAGPADDRK